MGVLVKYINFTLKITQRNHFFNNPAQTLKDKYNETEGVLLTMSSSLNIISEGKKNHSPLFRRYFLYFQVH